MASSGLTGATEGGFGAPILGGRLRPARPEEGIGLVWESDLPFLLGNAPAIAGHLFTFGPPAGLPGMPPVPNMPAPEPGAAFIVPTQPGQPLADVEGMPGVVPGRTGPRAGETAPGSDGPVTGLMPPARDLPLPQPLALPPAPPAPLFPPPVLANGTAQQVTVEENAEDILHLPEVTDRASEGLGWRIIGGADAALLLMDPASGALRFRTAPDFEAPADADADNLYEVVFEVRDGWGAAAQQALTVAVTDDPWG